MDPREDYADPPLSPRRRRLVWLVVLAAVIGGCSGTYYAVYRVVEHLNLLPPP